MSEWRYTSNILATKMSHTLCDAPVTNVIRRQRRIAKCDKASVLHASWTSRPVGLLKSDFNDSNQQPDRQEEMKRGKEKNLIWLPDFYGSWLKLLYTLQR
jgi:hypothetical protein